MKWALVSVALCACECRGEAPSAPAPAPPAVSEYFPASAGDRWRIRAGDELHTYAVTAVTERGTSVFFGTDRTQAERFVVTREQVSIAGPDDRPLAPYLDGPLVLGHSWSYRLGDTDCSASYASVDETVSLAGLTLDACVKVLRECRHPGGKPFPEPTTETHQEVFCPKVGRVAERVSLSPPPRIDGVVVAAERTYRVETYRVSGAPAPPARARFDCDSFLLMPTDVHAACGPQLRLSDPRGTSEQGECRYDFEGPSGGLQVRARRLEHDATDEDVARAVVDGVVAVREGPHVATVSAAATVCPRERLEHLLPTIASLLRD